MKPRNREINIFNLSMLDVISGALGAFLIIMIVLFPYYNKDSISYKKRIEEMERAAQSMQQQLADAREQVTQAQTETEQARNQLREAQADARSQLQESRAAADDLRRELGEAHRQLAKTFLVIYIRWATKNQDIDLHVVDPSGAEFYYKRKTVPNRPGELSEDSRMGPGNEVWEIFNAPPGKYRIYAKLFAKNSNNKTPTIKGRVIHRDGSKRLREIRLTSSDKVHMATVTVSEDGNVEIGQ